MQTFEDTIFNIANAALKDKFLALMDDRKEEITEIINEVFDRELAKEWIKEFIEYGDEFRSKVLEIAEDEMMAKVKGLFKDGSC